VRFLEAENLYVTATSNGQVKLWRSKSLEYLSTLNSDDWDVREMQTYIAKSWQDIEKMEGGEKHMK
jgi:hypothetical protein